MAAGYAVSITQLGQQCRHFSLGQPHDTDGNVSNSLLHVDHWVAKQVTCVSTYILCVGDPLMHNILGILVGQDDDLKLHIGRSVMLPLPDTPHRLEIRSVEMPVSTRQERAQFLPNSPWLSWSVLTNRDWTERELL